MKKSIKTPQIVNFINIDKKYLELNISSFIDILKNIPHEYWGEKEFLMDLEGKWDYSLAIILDKKLIGFIISSVKQQSLHIHKFMIHSEFRGRNYGYMLLNKFIENCGDKFKSITLKVYSDNLRAINFYKKNNFKTVDIVNDLILLKRDL